MDLFFASVDSPISPLFTVQDCCCNIESLNWVTSAPSFGPGLLRRGLARSTKTSCASVPRTSMVSLMNSASDIARGSLLLPIRSVWTQGSDLEYVDCRVLEFVALRKNI